MEKTFTETTYVICHNGADVIHPAKVEPGTNLATGQPQYEEFADEESWKARLTELGYDVTKLDPPVPPSLGRPEGRSGRPGGLLTPEERKTLTPEERKALRAERRAAPAAGATAPTPTPVPEGAPGAN